MKYYRSIGNMHILLTMMTDKHHKDIKNLYYCNYSFPCSGYSSWTQASRKLQLLLPTETEQTVSWDVPACKIHKIHSGKGCFLVNTTSNFLAMVPSK